MGATRARWVGAWVLALGSLSQGLWAATYEVGAGKPYANLQAVVDLLNPGDLVLVYGNATYAGGVIFDRPGTEAAPITIRGVRVNGLRPILSGGTNTVTFASSSATDGAHHYRFEGFEVTGGTFRGIYHQADDLVVSNCVVHDCPAHGILGADWGSGDCTLQFVEVYRCGNGSTQHQIYMATDEETHPGSVFRMQYCYLHDGIGGNNVKSRAERNEIYYNWIEGALYHELELIGPDPSMPAAPPREDSDVVGNVLVKRNTFFVVRFGGDGTGETGGRYRFVNNTVIAGSSAVFRLFDLLESVEMHNNVFYRASGAINMVRTAEARWVNGEQIAGSNNWVLTGTTNIPTQWTGTLTGASPGFADFANNDLRPAAGSPLLDAAPGTPSGPTGYDFPSPHFPPEFHPPLHAVSAISQATLRPSNGALDIGAYERASACVTRLGFAADRQSLSWAPSLGATTFDVVRGSLGTLRSSGGNFATAVNACLENDGTDERAADASSPSAGQGFFYLIRGGSGTYDSCGSGQVGSRDAGIAAAPSTCP